MARPNDHLQLAVQQGSPRRRYYTGRDPARALAIGDLRARAHRLMPRIALEYLEAGAGEEATLARERTAFADWRLVPHVLTGKGRAGVCGTLLGRRAALPLAIAPTGLNGLFARGADLMLARAAADFGVPFIQGTMSNERMEDVARVPKLRHWWQLYVFGGEEVWRELLRRADAAGCEALVLTTNAQVFGQREWDSRTRIGKSRPTVPAAIDAALHPRWMATTLYRGMPGFPNAVDFVPKDKRGFFECAFWIREQMKKDLNWDDVARIREAWKKPFFVKGLLHPDDIRAACDSGVDGVMLGQHGGRQADWSVSALDMLPRAREILGERRALYMSGGIRRGTDMMKALALGADAVLAGRAPLYGLCAYGEKGVKRALEILRGELRNELEQAGLADPGELGPDVLMARRDLPLAAAPHSTG